jgi:hypothetical protein
MANDDPDPKKFYKWTVEFEVNAVWVADGFEMTDDQARSMLAHRLAFAHGSELKASVIKAPNPDEVAREQGYTGANDPRKKRHDRG